MDDATTHVKALRATLGDDGRLISLSKSGYRERQPEHLAIFNADVCVASGKLLWHGDLDLTLDESKLVALSRQTGEIVYVLLEHHASLEQEQPLLAQAVFSVTPTGHTTFQHAWIERTKGGALQQRPPEPDTRPRWTWRVLWHRPRLLRFWLVERRETTERRQTRGDERGTLLYVGARDGGATPLLILGRFRAKGWRALGYELTWYPGHDPKRHAARPLISLHPGVGLGRLRLWLTFTVWPGFVYELRAGYELEERSP